MLLCTQQHSGHLMQFPMGKFFHFTDDDLEVAREYITLANGHITNERHSNIQTQI